MADNFLASYIRRHFHALWLIDVALCELIGGPRGFTLSGYSWEAEQRGLLWPKLWRPVIDKLAWWVQGQKDHCRLSYEAELRALRSDLDPAAYT